MRNVDFPRLGRVDRREFLALGIGALVVAAVPFRTLARGAKKFRRTVPVMGTIAEIIVVHRDEELANRAIDDAVNALKTTESRFTRYRDDSIVGRINAFAGSRELQVDEGIAHVLQSALKWANASDGTFDPCLLRVIQTWDVAHRTTPPQQTQFARFAGRRLYEKLELNTNSNGAVVHLRDRDAALDLGGIAKGYGVDLAIAALRKHGIEQAIVDVGGDLYALGESPEGRPWKIGIRSPSQPDRIDRTIDVADRAVATSGDYMQYFDYHGRRFHHILDPRSAEPALRKNASTTIIADRCIDADAGATATFSVNATRANEILRNAAPGSSTIRIGLG